MKFFGATAQMITPQGIGEKLASKVTGMPTSWELSSFPESWTFAKPHTDEQGKQLKPASVIFPYTQRGTKLAGTYGSAVGLTKDIENLALMPIKMIWQLRKPFKFLREDPVGFMMAGLMLRGGVSKGADVLAQKTAKSYIDSNLFRDYIVDIPNETFVKFGIDKSKVLKAVDKIPKDTRIPLRPEDYPKQLGAEKTIQHTFKEAKKLYELQTGKKLPEPEATPKFKTGDVLYRGEHEYRIANITEPQKGSGIFEYEVENVRSGEVAPGLGEKQISEMFTKKPGKALTGDEYANELAKNTLDTKIDFGVGLGNVVSKAVDDLVMMLNQTQAGRSVIGKIAQRGRFLRSKELKTSLLLQDITKGLTPQEMRSMTFFRQGITDFNALREAGYKDIIPNLVNPSSKLIEATKKIAEVFDRDFRYLEKYYDDILFTKKYIPNIWDIPRGEKAQFINYYKTFNPFTQKRKIPTLEEGLKRGYKLKVDNIKDIYRIYDKYKNEVIANTELANALFNMRDEIGRPLITRRQTQSNLDYKPLEHPVFGFRTKKAYVHPDIAKELSVIWERTDPGAVALAYDKVNAFLKFINLSLTLFHHGALSESGLAAIGPLKTTGTFFKSMYNALRGKTPKILTDEMRPYARHATKHGVVLKPSPDVRINIIEKTLQNIESKAPENISWIPKVLHKGFEVWNRALWDHMHNTLKVMSFEEFISKQLPKTKKAWKRKFGTEMTAKDIEKVKNEIGDFVNYSFGSLAWEKEGIGKMVLKPHLLLVARGR